MEEKTKTLLQEVFLKETLLFIFILLNMHLQHLESSSW